MAVETGTATNVADLINRIRLFVTTNSILVGLGQQWTQLAWNSGAGELYLRAPGTSGTENIYINFKTYSDVTGDIYGLICRGAIGYDGQLTFDNQPQNSGFGFMSAWHTDMPYWFIASGRRLIVIIKTDTSYHMTYAGKFLPFGTPTQYPSPIYIGTETDQYLKYSTSGSYSFRHFYDPALGCKVLRTDLAWHTVQNWTSSGATTTNVMHPCRGFSGDSFRTNTLDALRENIDGSYPLFPCSIVMSSPASEVLGELDGVYITSGFSSGNQDTITVGADTYMVFKNIYRTGVGETCAIKMV